MHVMHIKNSPATGNLKKKKKNSSTNRSHYPEKKKCSNQKATHKKENVCDTNIHTERS